MKRRNKKESKKRSSSSVTHHTSAVAFSFFSSPSSSVYLLFVFTFFSTSLTIFQKCSYNDVVGIFFLIHVMALTHRQAEQIVDDVLSTDDKVLAISIMDRRGNILAAKSKESFKQAFGVSRDGDKYGGSLAVAALDVANEVKDIVGEAQAITAVYKDCKMMLLPIPAYKILVGFVLEPSILPEEDYSLAYKIEKLLAERDR
jgi:hypothetical protein